MFAFSRMASALAAVVFAVGTAHAQGQTVCNEQEVESLNAYYVLVFEVTQRYLEGGSLDMNRLIEQSGRLDSQLSPECRGALARVAPLMQGSIQSGRRAPPISNILYDSGTDTYIMPNTAACGPSGCIPLD